MVRSITAFAVWTVLMIGALMTGADRSEHVATPTTLPAATTTSSTTTTSTTSTTTSTTTTTLPTLVAGVKGCPSLEPLLADYGLPADPFSYIAWRESRCNPNAVNAKWNANGEMTWALNKNGTYDTGLLQINSIHRALIRRTCGKDAVKNNLQGLYDLDCQLRVAAVLYDNGKGLSHWRASYKQDK